MAAPVVEFEAWHVKQVAGGARDQGFTGSSDGQHAGSGMDCHAPYIAGDEFHFPGVDAGPELNLKASNCVVQCCTSANRPLRTIEEGEDPVTGSLHEPAAMAI